MAKDKQPTVRDELDKATARIALLEKKGPIDPYEPDGTIKKLNLKFEEKEKGDVREALRHPAIRRFLFRILNMSEILGDSSDPNPYIVYHHTGRRSLGLQIYKAITEVDPSVYSQMQREAESDKKSIQEENEDAL